MREIFDLSISYLDDDGNVQAFTCATTSEPSHEAIAEYAKHELGIELSLATMPRNLHEGDGTPAAIAWLVEQFMRDDDRDPVPTFVPDQRDVRMNELERDVRNTHRKIDKVIDLLSKNGAMAPAEMRQPIAVTRTPTRPMPPLEAPGVTMVCQKHSFMWNDECLSCNVARGRVKQAPGGKFEDDLPPAKNEVDPTEVVTGRRRDQEFGVSREMSNGKMDLVGPTPSTEIFIPGDGEQDDPNDAEARKRRKARIPRVGTSLTSFQKPIDE